MRKNLNKAAIRKAGAGPGSRIIRDARPGNPKSGLVQGSGPNKAMPNPNRKQAPF